MIKQFSLIRSYKLLGYYSKIIKKLNYKPAYLCDSIDSKIKIENCISGKFIKNDCLVILKDCDPPRNSKNFIDFKKVNFKNVDTLFVIRHFSIDSLGLKNLVDQIKKKNKNIAICDQTSYIWECWSEKKNLNYFFRNVQLNVQKNKLMPSYFFNDSYIDIINKIIKKNKYKSMLDMCCGSGVIGLSVHKDMNLKKLTLSDIDSTISNSIKTSLKSNNFNSTKVKFLTSDGFKKFKEKDRYDLVVLNPPFVDLKINSHHQLNGHDPGFKFTKSFFENVSKF
ncbi:methyltransferase, partial [Candidatus Pelagibacter ubique]|nr:methyltransferase [Candidatus Pelagibacter ubique]